MVFVTEPDFDNFLKLAVAKFKSGAFSPSVVAIAYPVEWDRQGKRSFWFFLDLPATAQNKARIHDLGYNVLKTVGIHTGSKFGNKFYCRVNSTHFDQISFIGYLHKKKYFKRFTKNV